jgi:hypothetical protein
MANRLGVIKVTGISGACFTGRILYNSIAIVRGKENS